MINQRSINGSHWGVGGRGGEGRGDLLNVSNQEGPKLRWVTKEKGRKHVTHKKKAKERVGLLYVSILSRGVCVHNVND